MKQVANKTGLLSTDYTALYILEDRALCNHRCENLKSYTVFLYGEASHRQVRQFENYVKALLATRFMLVSCLAYFLTLKMRLYVPPKRWLTFSGLHGIIFQKTDLFKDAR
jgi:hypothetical protein